jgi:DNA topoisomerase-1
LIDERNMSKKLVVVESPAKARTLGKIMGKQYTIKASMGHVRDLPQKVLGVDVDNGFTPEYVVPSNKRPIVKEIREAASGSADIYLATDPDREGEAISWHLIEAAKLRQTRIHRVVFHEITEQAIKDAFRHPRQINMDLVNAQQARRIMDRLVGYKISPLLWRKVRARLSAGRVQSVALRMIVEREEEIRQFVPQEYWTIEAELSKDAEGKKPKTFRTRLAAIQGDEQKFEICNETQATAIADDLKDASYTVSQVKQRRVSRQPSPPFITSTLQQEAWRKLRFTGQRTMSVAQELYEGLPVGNEGEVGLITYMRTDSTRVAESAVAEARSFIASKYGPEFLPPNPRVFAKKVKGAQEAHEAIRPTKMEREPELIKDYLTTDQAKLYRLIWERMTASQMAAAQFDTTSVDISAATKAGDKTYLLRASGSVPHFMGFLVLYSEGKDDAEARDENGKPRLPPLARGEVLRLMDLFKDQHFTEPPPRYNEATLVKALEEKGIGRPSTYAPIIGTLRRRGYVETNEGRFRPLELGTTVNTALVAHFPKIVDASFTARMEEELDEIARGQRTWNGAVKDFYLPFSEMLNRASVEMVKVKVPDEPTDEVCTACGKPMVIRSGRFGRFMACTGFPKCRNTKKIGGNSQDGSEDKPKGKFRYGRRRWAKGARKKK